MKERYTYKNKTIEAIPSNGEGCKYCDLSINGINCNTDLVNAFKAKDCVFTHEEPVIFKYVAVTKKRKLSEKELMKRKFYKFLYDNDALFEYIKNIENNKKITIAKWFKMIPIDRNSILNAFVWTKTSEGHKHWMELDFKWKKVC